MRNVSIEKFDYNDSNMVSLLATLYTSKINEAFPRLPELKTQFHIDWLNASERPTYFDDFFFIKIDSSVLGFIMYRFNKLTDLDQLFITGYINPEQRRQGYFKQALALVEDIIPSNITIITSECVTSFEEKSDNWLQSYLLRIGSKIVYKDVMNVSKFNSFSLSDVKLKKDKLVEMAKSNGYEFIHIFNDDFSEHPELNYQQFIETVGIIWNDMPREDASWEDEPISEDIYQSIIKNIQERNGCGELVLAIEAETDKVVGLTAIYYYETTPEIIYQGDTGVIPQHRGNTLGLTLKYIMLNYILERDWKPLLWITGNAGSNQHMLRINKELNYKPWYNEKYTEITREDYLKWLHS